MFLSTCRSITHFRKCWDRPFEGELMILMASAVRRTPWGKGVQCHGADPCDGLLLMMSSEVLQQHCNWYSIIVVLVPERERAIPSC